MGKEGNKKNKIYSPTNAIGKFEIAGAERGKDASHMSHLTLLSSVTIPSRLYTATYTIAIPNVIAVLYLISRSRDQPAQKITVFPIPPPDPRGAKFIIIHLPPLTTCYHLPLFYHLYIPRPLTTATYRTSSKSPLPPPPHTPSRLLALSRGCGDGWYTESPDGQVLGPRLKYWTGLLRGGGGEAEGGEEGRGWNGAEGSSSL